MIEFIIEIVVTVLWEIGIQTAMEFLIAFGGLSIGESVRARGRGRPLWAGAGTLLLGGLTGAITRLLWPGRILPQGPVPGASLLLSPLMAGLVMDRYGAWRESRGWLRSYVATFWGGALFAFGMALVRFLWSAR